MIAGAADQIVQPGAFASQDKHGIGPEIVAVVIRGAALVQADAPEVALLEHFEGADEIDDAGEAEVLGGSGRRLDGDGTERGRAALGEQDAVDAGGFGSAEKRAEVLRVFDAIESQDRRGSGPSSRSSTSRNSRCWTTATTPWWAAVPAIWVRASRGSVRTGTPPRGRAP